VRRSTAVVGSAVFFLLAPGVVSGLIPWWLTRWQPHEPLPYWAPVRMLGSLLLVAGLIALVRAFIRFVVVPTRGTRLVASPASLGTRGARQPGRRVMPLPPTGSPCSSSCG
jgi:hypothetical protein